MSIRTKGKEIILRALLLCLCAMLAAGCACAEKTEGVDLGMGEKEFLYYGTTLSDGRILMVGAHGMNGGTQISGRLLCLNPDRTVSWEYIGDDYSDGVFFRAAELEDGTIGLVFRPATENTDSAYILRFFTTDGKPTGKEISIPCRKDAVLIRNVTKSRLQLLDMEEIREAGENQYRSVHYDNYLIDWEGKEAAFLENFELGTADGDMIEEADGLVMNGYNFQEHKFGKTVRKTDLQGNRIWETGLECAWPDTTRADAERMIPAGDGGYFVLQTEPIQHEGDMEREYRCALVKLDRDGNVLWTRTEGFEEFMYGGGLLATAGGKIAVSFISIEKDGETCRLDNPRRIAWFDENGKFLGNAETVFSTENFPELKRIIETTADGAERMLRLFEDRIIPMEDGMWINGQIQVARAESDVLWSNVFFDASLFKVPEP